MKTKYEVYFVCATSRIPYFINVNLRILIWSMAATCKQLIYFFSKDVFCTQGKVHIPAEILYYYVLVLLSFYNKCNNNFDYFHHTMDGEFPFRVLIYFVK